MKWKSLWSSGELRPGAEVRGGEAEIVIGDEEERSKLRTCRGGGWGGGGSQWLI